MQRSCQQVGPYFVHMRAQMYAFMMLGNISGCIVKFDDWISAPSIGIERSVEQHQLAKNDKVYTIRSLWSETYLLHTILFIAHNRNSATFMKKPQKH